jgi:hypothetical protein
MRHRGRRGLIVLSWSLIAQGRHRLERCGRREPWNPTRFSLI